MSQPGPPLVLHVIHHLLIGGMENGLVNLINHMPVDRYRHAIACVEDYSDFRDRIQRPDVEVYPLYRSKTGVWKLRHNLYALIRRTRPAIVHSRNLSGLDALVPALFARVRCRIHGEHGRTVGDLTGAERRPALLRKIHSPLVTRFVTVSKDLESYLVNRIGVAPGRIAQIYNGVDTTRFSPVSKPDRTAYPAGFHDPSLFVCGTVGRLHAVKNQTALVHAFAGLCTTAPDSAPTLRLVIAGGGPMENEIRALIKTLGLGDRVWMAGPTDDVRKVLRGLDLFVLPSLGEGISNTVLEAMASGLPVIASAVGGNVELVENGRTGRLFSPRDDKALSALIHEYFIDRGKLTRDGELARQLAEQRFSLNSMVAGYTGLYDTLLGKQQNVALPMT